MTADSFNAARNSPHLEVFRKKGIEVLLLSDRVDEWVVGHVTEFDGKALTSVAKGGLDLGALEDEAEKKEREQEATRPQALVDRIKASLGERVKEVRVTHRLTESPACLVADLHDMSGNLARLLKAAGQSGPTAKPILEINPKHPVVLRLDDEDKRVRRLGGGAARSGAAGRRRPARRPGDLRPAHQPADAGDERRGIAHHPSGVTDGRKVSRSRFDLAGNFG